MAWFGSYYRVTPPEMFLEAIGIADEGYGSYIWADSLDEAESLAWIRGIGEKISGRSFMGKHYCPYIPMCSRMDFFKGEMSTEQKLSIIHHSCWASYISRKPLKISAEHIVGDNGIVHNMVHWADSDSTYQPLLVEAIEEWERSIPGYWPKDRKMTGDIDDDLMRELQSLEPSKGQRPVP